MKVTLATHGGLAAAINFRLPPQVVDTNTLPKPVTGELAQLVSAAKAAEAAKASREKGRARDAMSYTITVDDGGQQVTLVESDTTMSQEFAALLSWIEQHS